MPGSPESSSPPPYRYLDDAYAIDPAPRSGPGRPRCPARGRAAVRAARTPARPAWTPPSWPAAPQLRPGRHLRISVNLSRPWHKAATPADPGPAAETQGQPGLAVRHPLRRPPDKQRIGERRPRLQARRENQPLLAHPGNPQRHCRIRSYLTTARSHGRHPLAAIRDALNGTAGCHRNQHDQLTGPP